MSKVKHEKWRVFEQKLGRMGAAGICDYKKCEILIDPRQCSKERMDTLIHEMIHALFSDLSERQVIKYSKLMTGVLWDDGYRRIEK